jgi:chromosome segregation ATPase
MNDEETVLLGAIARLRGLLEHTVQKHAELEHKVASAVTVPSSASYVLRCPGQNKTNLNKEAFKIEILSRENNDNKEYVKELTQKIREKDQDILETKRRADESLKAFRESELEMQNKIESLRKIEIAYLLQHAEINNTLELVGKTRNENKKLYDKMEELAEDARLAALLSAQQNEDIKAMKKALESSRSTTEELKKRLEGNDTSRLVMESAFLQEKSKSSHYKQQLAAVEKMVQDRLHESTILKEHAAKSHAARGKVEEELRAAQSSIRALQLAFDDLSQSHDRTLKDMQSCTNQQQESIESDVDPPLKKARGSDKADLPTTTPNSSTLATAAADPAIQTPTVVEDKCFLCKSNGQGLTKTCGSCHAVLHSFCLRKRGSGTTACPSCRGAL